MTVEVDEIERHDLIKVVQIQIELILGALETIDQGALVDVQRFRSFGEIKMRVTPTGDHFQNLIPIFIFIDFAQQGGGDVFAGGIVHAQHQLFKQDIVGRQIAVGNLAQIKYAQDFRCVLIGAVEFAGVAHG